MDLGGRTVVMSKGRVQSCGDADFIRSIYGHGYVLKLYRHLPPLNANANNNGASTPSSSLSLSSVVPLDVARVDALVMRLAPGAVVLSGRFTHTCCVCQS
jgi:hypothetical protein